MGLAAALMSDSNPFEASEALHEMLLKTAAKNTSLPTRTQLGDLLSSLERRCHAAGFADNVAGWLRLVRPHTSIPLPVKVPDPSSLGRVLDSFRQLNRIGQMTVNKTTIKSQGCIPWLAAFSKWCSGIPPSIYLHDGTAILREPSSRVDLVANYYDHDMPGLKCEVITHDTVDELSHLAVPEFGRLWSGMVSIPEYGQQLLQDLDLDSREAKKLSAKHFLLHVPRY